MSNEPKQVDITDPKIPIVELYKMDIDQRNQLDILKAQAQQTLMNIQAIEAEIAKREKETA